MDRDMYDRRQVDLYRLARRIQGVVRLERVLAIVVMAILVVWLVDRFVL